MNEFELKVAQDVELIWYALEKMMCFVPEENRKEVYKSVELRSIEIKKQLELDQYALKCLDNNFEIVMNKLGYYRE